MSQQPPPPGPPNYGYPPQPVPQTSSDAVIAFVLSLLSWATCPVVLAIISLVFASKARNAIDASGGWVTGDGLVTASKVISWVNIIVFGLGGLLFAIFIVVAAMTADTGGLDMTEALTLFR